MIAKSRREFLRALGVSPAALPFLAGLPSLASPRAAAKPKQRLVVIFSPNGVVPETFWPEAPQEPLVLSPSLKPLQPFKDKTLVLRGIDCRVRGDGDDHMRGIGCLLTGVELLPGNIQGGGHTPAGWASGASVDQEIKSHLQKSDDTLTRFGSLEFGVQVPERADVWTRMVYRDANRPITPISDPRQMFAKLYGRKQNGKLLASVLDALQEDFRKVESLVSDEDRRMLNEHAGLVRSMELSLVAEEQQATHAVPEIDPRIRQDNDHAPQLSRTQIELLVSSFLGDAARVATLQYTNSVGQLRLRWLGIEEGHHELSHKPDTDADAAEKLTRINHWYCGEVARLAKRLAETPEPGGAGSLLDNTLIVWTNELGKGNSHTHKDVPYVLVGGAGLGVRGGRSLHLGGVPHNRLLLWLAQGFGLDRNTFGMPTLCEGGPLTGLS